MVMGEKRSILAAILMASFVVALAGGIFSGPALAYPAGWTSDIYVGSTAYQSLDIATWGDTVLLVWKDRAGHVMCKRSTNGGLTWAYPAYPSKLSTGRMDRSSSECLDPQVAMNGNIAYIAYKTRNEPHDAWAGFPADRDYVVVKRSDDGGATFNNLDPGTHQTRGTWYGITPASRSVDNFDLDRCSVTEPFLLAYQESNGGSQVKNGFLHNVGVMASDGSDQGLQIPTQAAGRAVICPAVSGAGANEYYVSFIERNWESSPGELVAAARYLEGQGWSDWYTLPSGQKAVSLDGYKAHGALRDIDVSCISGAQMRVVWDDTSSGKHEVKLRVLDTNQTQGLSSMRSVDYAPFPKTCRGRELRVYRGQNSGDGRRYLKDAATDSTLLDLGGASQENSNTFNLDQDGRAGSRAYLVGTRLSDGKIYIKRTDVTAPASDPVKVNGQPPSTSPTYFKASFPLSLTNVKDLDWNVTGTDIKSKFNNGVTSVAFKYAPKSSPNSWTTLKTINATGATGLSWATSVSVPGLANGRYYFKGTITDTAGNSSDSTRSGEIVIDTSPPDTNLVSEGTPGEDGWFTSDVTVKLNPVDSYGVEHTKCRIKNNLDGSCGEWNNYGGPFVITEGQWTVEYYSVDKAGNTEATKASGLKVDKTAPSAAILTPEKDAIQTGFEPSQAVLVSGVGSDSGSGLASETLLKDDVRMGAAKTGGFDDPIYVIWDVSKEKAGVYEIELSAKDNAGNIGTATRRVNLDSFSKDWYLAEGNTLPEFTEYLCVINPGDQPARVQLDFMLEDGSVVHPDVHMVAPRTRATLRVKDYVPEGHSGVSAKVHCDNQAIVVERPMYFHYKAADPDRNWKGGHIARGINTLQKQYYFAEGTTRQAGNGGPFDEWLTLQNPGETPANVNITYMLGDGASIEKAYQVASHSRITVSVNNDVGLDKDVSAKVTSDVPLVAERPQYQNYRGYAVDGHNVVGASSPMRKWHFAEGTTKNGFEEWITIQNPGDVEANVTMTYMNGEGKVTTAKKTVPPRSRGTVKVLEDVGDGQDVSADVESDQPIVAERPMYFDYKMKWDGASVAMGETSSSKTFYIAEGCTLSDFETYYCIQNANKADATVTVTYMLGDGTLVVRKYSVKAQSRLTVNVCDEDTGVGPGKNVSAKIASDVPVMIERPMYFNCGGCVGGHVGSAYGID